MMHHPFAIDSDESTMPLGGSAYQTPRESASSSRDSFPTTDANSESEARPILNARRHLGSLAVPDRVLTLSDRSMGRTWTDL
jgi:hypothetical protein